MGGGNEQENLVKLSARQHFLAHWLLYKIHRTYELATAWHKMCYVGRGQDERKVNSRLFARAKEVRSKILSQRMSGSNNPFYGKRHDPETQERIRQKNIGKVLSSETRRKMSEKRKGVPKTEQHKQKIGRKGLVALTNRYTNEHIRIPKEDRDQYDPQVWVNQYVLFMERAVEITCPYCLMTKRDSSTFRRWHFENCRSKPDHENN
jgi:hypothetical protein